MKKFFSLIAAVLFAGSMMAEEATMTAGTNGSACTVNDVAGIKCGTSSKAGEMTITVGAGATKLSFYAAAWNGVSGLSLNLAADGVTFSPASVSLTADAGISNNSPFTLSGLPENFKFEVDLTGVTAETTIAVTSSAAKRFVVWGASYEVGGVTPPAVATPVISGEAEFTESVIVTITCSTPDADIYYTTDGTTDPTCDCAAAPEYTQQIVLTETTTIMAAAYTGNDWSAVATKTFTKVEPLADPTNCAEAAEAALSVSGNNVPYNNGKEYTIEGYVTSIATEWNSQYKNISFWMADAADGGNVLQAYRAACETEADAPAVGDKVAVTGTLTKYNTTPEFAAGCTFVIASAPVEPLMKTIYCKMEQDWWKADGAAVGIYAWDANGTAKVAWPGERMTPVEGEADLWSFELDINTYENCIFTRVNGEGEVADWGAKTANLTIPTDENDLFTITSETAVWGNPGCIGAWSKYEPAAPVEMTAIYDWAGEIGTTIFGGNSNITTGTIKIHENTDEVSGIKFGSSYVYAEGKYIAIKPAEGGFKAGDVLSVSVVFNNSDATKYCMVDLRAADGDTRIWMSDSLSTLNGRNAGEPIVQTYTLAADQDSLLLGRYGNTGMFVTLLKVERAGGDVPVVLEAPDAAPAAPTYPANQVHAMYSATYNADCGFGEWGSGTQVTQEEFGKKYVTTQLGYFGMEFPAGVDCSNMEALHLDVWAANDISLRVVPIHGGTEVGKTVAIEGQKWNAIDIPLTEFVGVENWSNVIQIKIDEARGVTFWLNNVYFYTTQEQFTYTVAGSSAAAFGTTWDPANAANDMVRQEDGTYKWEKTNLELAEGEIAFKVCENHAWTNAWPAQDYKLAIPEGGLYTVTITFDPAAEADKVAAVAQKTGEAVVLPTVILHGNFMGNWADTDPFVAAADRLTASLTLTLAEGTYEFGFKFDGAWKANGANITRDANTANLATGEGNMHITADVAGEYVFVYTFATQELVVTYPVNALTIPEDAPVPTVAEEDVMAIYCNHYANNNANFGISGWAGGYQTLDLNGINVGYWTGMTWECIIDPAHTDDAHDFSAYKNLHVDLWAPLPAKIKFTAEAVAGGNYKEGQVVEMQQGWNNVDFVVAEWPGNYDFKNLKCFVFEQYQTLEGESFEGNPFAFANIYFYGKEGQGIDNTNVEMNAVKFIENGQLIILKNGVKYNVMGVIVR